MTATGRVSLVSFIWIPVSSRPTCDTSSRRRRLSRSRKRQLRKAIRPEQHFARREQAFTRAVHGTAPIPGGEGDARDFALVENLGLPHFIVADDRRNACFCRSLGDGD